MELSIENTDEIRNLIVDPTSVNENLKCKLCNRLVVNPKECNQCEMLFCSTCIQEWINKDSLCPNRCQEFLIQSPHRFIRNAIQQLIVKCKNNDCHQQMTIENLDNHIKNCDYSTQVCNNNGCNKQIQKQFMNDHLNNCQFKVMFCVKCTTSYTLQSQHDCILQLNYKIQQLEEFQQKYQYYTQNLITELLNRIIKCEKKDQNPRCKLGHVLKWIYPLNNVMCDNCKLINTSIRYQCEDCQTNYCQKCRQPQFHEGFCPVNHHLQFSQKSLQFVHCDYCNLNIFSKGDSVYSDRICDLDVCNTCYQSLRKIHQQ